jgi:hypothetical protein
MQIPIYVSLTSIFKNQKQLLETLISITKQTCLPNKIFLYLSEEPYILDTGFINKQITNLELVNFLNQNKNLIKTTWVKNEGPYRKLLPLLRQKWNEDCIIITIDDDTFYDNKLIENMVKDYNNHKCVISYFGFTPVFIQKTGRIEDFNSKARGPLIKKHIYNFPFGKGGILYKPQFFHKTKNLFFNKNFYMKICDKQDDLWLYILRVKNNVECFLDNKRYMVKDNSNNGLYNVFNEKNNNNTVVFKKIIEELKITNNF